MNTQRMTHADGCPAAHNPRHGCSCATDGVAHDDLCPAASRCPDCGCRRCECDLIARVRTDERENRIAAVEAARAEGVQMGEDHGYLENYVFTPESLADWELRARAKGQRDEREAAAQRVLAVEHWPSYDSNGITVYTFTSDPVDAVRAIKAGP